MSRLFVGTVWPHAFYIEPGKGRGKPTYSMRELETDNEHVVTQEVWRDALAAAHGTALSQLADAFDPNFEVRRGEVLPIAMSLAIAAENACPVDMTGDDADGEIGGVEIFPKKPSGQEPS